MAVFPSPDGIHRQTSSSSSKAFDFDQVALCRLSPFALHREGGYNVRAEAAPLIEALGTKGTFSSCMWVAGENLRRCFELRVVFVVVKT